MLVKNFKPLDKRVSLSTPTIHETDREYLIDAFDSGWVTTAGHYIKDAEDISAKFCGTKYAVGLSSCTAALHLCAKLAGERLYGKPEIGHGALEGKRVFCSDMTFAATLNPLVYEGAKPVFIDTDSLSWNMSPEALEKAFEIYPDVRLVAFAHLYGFPGRIDEIKEICVKHNALLIEDAAEALGAYYKDKPCGSYGDYSAISFNGNKIITGSSGGCLLTNSLEDANKARKWSTQAREAAPWYEHEEVGYNYRMSNVVAAIIKGQYDYLDEHIAQKKEIYERYKDGLKDIPVSVNPYNPDTSKPNYWLTAITIDSEYLSKQVRSDKESCYFKEHGRSCPDEILEALKSVNAEGRPIWKPMNMQPMYRLNPFITKDGNIRARTNAYIESSNENISLDIYSRGLCLPSDNKMSKDEQDYIIEAIKGCFE